MKSFVQLYLSANKDEYQRGLIITDDLAIDPLLDFKLYTDAIVKIIKESYPKFTIGLFGDWGTGKTTLMNSIYKKLQKEDNSILVRFETWRYEREEQFALIPLLKTIAFALPSEDQFQGLGEKLKRGAINLFKKSPDIASSIISKYLGEQTGKITEEVIESFRREFNSKLELLAELDRDTLYFDGFEDIKKEIQKLREYNPHFRIVVFVDDLDRCSPRKTLEVLESIKVFLGMEGFIYVIGLSHDIVTKLIDIEYKETGVKGEQYIKKIIQIPITLPKWDKQDITKLIQDFIDKKLIHDDYKTILDRDLVSSAVETNPREVKRFLNNFIVAYEIFHPIENFKANELLLIQAIQLRWNGFYNLLMTSGDKTFRRELERYAQMDDFTRVKTLESEMIKEADKDEVLRIRGLLSNHKTDSDLWKFLAKNSHTLNNIVNLTIYRRAIDVGVEPTAMNLYAYDLLRNGKIDQFNARVKDFGVLDLSGVDLKGANLVNAKLMNAKLGWADLTAAILVGADLSGAILAWANLTNADLSDANLNGVNFRQTTLINAKLEGASMVGANLLNTNLNGASLVRANLSDSKIVQPVFDEMTRLNNETIFSGSSIDKSDFVEFIRKFTSYIPKKE